MAKKTSIPVEVVRIIVPLLIIGAGIWGFRVFGKPPEVPSQDTTVESSVIVETASAEEFRGEFLIETDGVSVPYREVTVTAEVAGRITKKSLASRAGSFIRDGDLLFQIDETDYKLEIDRLQAQLSQANEELIAADVDVASNKSLLELAKQELTIQKRQLERVEDGAKRRALTDSEVDEQLRAELAARNALQMIQNQLSSLAQKKKTLGAARDLVQAQLERAKIDRSRTTVISPVTGTVIADLVEENEYVKKGDPLIHINETNRMEVRLNLKVDELYWILLQSKVFAPGNEAADGTRFEIPKTPAKIIFDFDDSEFVWSGTLSRYEGTGIDERTRTIPCRVLVDKPTQVRRTSGGRSESLSLPTLFTGLFVKVRIPIQPAVPLVRIPVSALRPGGQVWLVRDGKLRIVAADVARSENDSVLIRRTESGLQPGDKVVTSPLPAVRAGMSVKEMPQ